MSTIALIFWKLCDVTVSCNAVSMFISDSIQSLVQFKLNEFNNHMQINHLVERRLIHEIDFSHLSFVVYNNFECVQSKQKKSICVLFH